MAPAAPPELDLVLPVEPHSVPAARRAVEDVARACGACTGTVEALRLAVSEACTNVILHAYRDTGDVGRMHVHAAADGDDLRVVVCDHGVGFAPRTDSPGLGLGLPLMGQLTERLDVEHDDGVNRLSMLFRLDRPPKAYADAARPTATAVAG
jgi:anti-sigma regulatory factor (Ser/Thr protein kinase)